MNNNKITKEQQEQEQQQDQRQAFNRLLLASSGPKENVHNNFIYT